MILIEMNTLFRETKTKGKGHASAAAAGAAAAALLVGVVDLILHRAPAQLLCSETAPASGWLRAARRDPGQRVGLPSNWHGARSLLQTRTGGPRRYVAAILCIVPVAASSSMILHPCIPPVIGPPLWQVCCVYKGQCARRELVGEGPKYRGLGGKERCRGMKRCWLPDRLCLGSLCSGLLKIGKRNLHNPAVF